MRFRVAQETLTVAWIIPTCSPAVSVLCILYVPASRHPNPRTNGMAVSPQAVPAGVRPVAPGAHGNQRMPKPQQNGIKQPVMTKRSHTSPLLAHGVMLFSWQFVCMCKLCMISENEVVSKSQSSARRVAGNATPLNEIRKFTSGFRHYVTARYMLPLSDANSRTADLPSDSRTATANRPQQQQQQHKTTYTNTSLHRQTSFTGGSHHQNGVSNNAAPTRVSLRRTRSKSPGKALQVRRNFLLSSLFSLYACLSALCTYLHVQYLCIVASFSVG